jgi:hypothetical protein
MLLSQSESGVFQPKVRLWSTILNITFFMLCVMMLSWCALYNRFPLVFSDTGEYICIAIENFISSSRPIFYSWFIFPFHLKLSLWPVIFTQALIVLITFFLTLRVLFGKVSKIVLISLIFLLSAFSSVSLYVSQVMPDLFTPLIVLSLYILSFHQERLNKWEVIYFMLILIVSILSHLTHAVLSLSLFIVVAVLWIKFHRIYKIDFKNIFIVAITIFLSISAMFSVHLIHRGEFTISPYSHVFLMGRFLSDGTAKKYLVENCPTKDYALCEFIDELPEATHLYIWSPASPLYKTGGWEGSRKESRDIIFGSLTSYPFWHLKLAIEATIQQILTFQSGFELTPTLPNAYLTKAIEKYFPADYENYRSSLLNKKKFPMPALMKIHNIGILLSLIVALPLTIVFYFQKKYDFTVLFFIILAALVSNAFLCGALAGVYHRYQSRLMWLLPFYAGLALIRLISDRK